MTILMIPAAGRGQRFAPESVSTPKPLMPVVTGAGVFPMGALQMRMMPIDWHLAYGVRAELREKFRATMHNNSDIIVCPNADGGQSSTLLDMCNALPKHENCVVVNSDVYHDLELDTLMYSANAVDATCAVTVFKSTEGCYSYVDQVPYFTRAVEKQVLPSCAALSGMYFFRTVAILQEALMQQHNQGRRHMGEFYLSGALEHVPGRKVARYVPPDKFVDLGTPEKLRQAAPFLMNLY